MSSFGFRRAGSVEAAKVYWKLSYAWQTRSFQGDVLEMDVEQLATGGYVLHMVDQRENRSHRLGIKD